MPPTLDNPLTEPPDDLRWRCLRARPKGEHLAAQHLRAAGFEAFSPRIRHQKKTTRGRIWFVEAMFPGYLFCRYSVKESLRLCFLGHDLHARRCRRAG